MSRSDLDVGLQWDATQMQPLAGNDPAVLWLALEPEPAQTYRQGCWGQLWVWQMGALGLASVSGGR